MAKIIYTRTDEAPLLATYSLKPIIEAFATSAGVDVETRDISLAARVLAQFADRLPADQQVADALTELGELAKTPEANIIKLPNISASVPQLKATIAELQSQGFDLPDYPEEPETDEDKDVKARYDKVKGSAVNPVLREGNSDRRAPEAVKNYAKKHPHSMGAWSPESKTNVATMDADDFRANEQSVVMGADDTLSIVLVTDSGDEVVLKESLPVLAGEVVDATKMNVAALDEFLRAQIQRAKDEGVLFSVHLKATMMKVSDPILFGHVIEAFFPEVFAEYGDALAEAGLTPDNGLAAILDGSMPCPPRWRPVCVPASRRLRRGTGTGHGQLRQGHHQPPRALRRHRRCLDARDDPRRREDVGQGRSDAGHAGRHPRLLVCRDLPDRHRRLPRQRGLRSHDHGHRSQRRSHGAEGRGIRQP